MSSSLQHLIARLEIAVWLSTNRHSWRRRVVADDSPLVHARGTDPDRVLLAGDGAATGRGVVTHDLGLPGYLARSLSSRSGRATDVDIVVHGDMTARALLPALDSVDLGLFDIVVLSSGANEALALTSTTRWREALSDLLDAVLAKAPSATKIFLLPIPFFSINPHFPARLAAIVDQHIDDMNVMTAGVVASLPRVEMIPAGVVRAYEPEGARLYQRWAEAIASRISEVLDPARIQVGDTETDQQPPRRSALFEFDSLDDGADPVLNSLANQARQAFGTSIAAVTLVERDRQRMPAASGIDPIVLPRSESFCDVTVRRASHFVIEDARLDPRYADYEMVSGPHGVRFYAGYPIEAPDGTRIGALCLMDTEPRSFSPGDAETLRSLAQTVQAHLRGRQLD